RGRRSAAEPPGKCPRNRGHDVAADRATEDERPAGGRARSGAPARSPPADRRRGSAPARIARRLRPSWPFPTLMSPTSTCKTLPFVGQFFPQGPLEDERHATEPLALLSGSLQEKIAAARPVAPFFLLTLADRRSKKAETGHIPTSGEVMRFLQYLNRG